MRPKIYLFGDSITEESFGDGGWGASLSHHFSRSADIVLRGYSGYNTRWALKVFDRVFPAGGDDGSAPPLAVVVFFGANDACLPDRCSAFQHVPLDEYKQNLSSIISSIKKRWHDTIILLVTPPPIDEAARLRYPFVENGSGKPERTNEAAGEYAKACTMVAKECRVLVADIWTKMQELPNWEETCLSFSELAQVTVTHPKKWVEEGDDLHLDYKNEMNWYARGGVLTYVNKRFQFKSKDGLHLSRQGNKVVFEAVVEKLKEAGLSLENLQVDLPLLADMDPKDPLKAFE